MKIPRALFLAAALAGVSTEAAPAPVRLINEGDRVRVEVGGRPFTAYVFGDGATRSYCYPVLAADGTPLTRQFPQEKIAGEETDHKWHRSVFFAHSSVNGVDFWNEGSGDAAHSPSGKGHTVVDGEVTTSDGAIGVLRVRDRWVGPDGRLVCTDRREIRFSGEGDARYIDWDVTLVALPGEPLVMGDNKDGTMGTRVAQWMTAPHKLAPGGVAGGGHIVTATGRRDDDAWGTRADWADYCAPHGGRVYGIALFDHPANLRHPTWWMARGYGLFGANPFGRHDYEHRPAEPHLGDYSVPAGGELRLRYRLYFHFGDTAAAGVAQAYGRYAADAPK